MLSETVFNPFSTSRIRPGSIRFEFADRQNLSEVVKQFSSSGFVGQIVGPHGSGKTTLALEIADRLADQFASVRRVTVRGFNEVVANQRSIDGLPKDLDSKLIILDGIERIPRLHFWLLRGNLRRLGIGLLLTTHRPLPRVPIVFTTHPDVETLQAVVRQIAPELNVDPDLIKQTFELNHEDVRETLMSLYDWYENQAGVAETNNQPVCNPPKS